MFKGTATITPVNDNPPFKVSGTWLFKPEYCTWYCQNRSYPADIVSDFVEEDGQ